MVCVAGRLCDVSLSFLGQYSDGRTVLLCKSEQHRYASEKGTTVLCDCVQMCFLCDTV